MKTPAKLNSEWRVFCRAAIVLLLPLTAQGGSWDETRNNGAIAAQEGRFADAKALLEAALASFPIEAGDLKRIQLFNELAGVYTILGDWGPAERAYREALNLLDRHPEVSPAAKIAVMGGLSSLRASQGNFEEAARLLESAIKASPGQNGEQDVRTVTLKSNLAQIYILDGRLAEAEPLLVEAQRSLRARLPAEHLDRVVSTSTLGYLYLLQGRFEMAEPLLREATNAAQKAGDSHPVLAFTLSNLADLYRVEGNPGRADPLFKKALAIYETTLGADSLKVAETLLDMSLDTMTAKKFAVAGRQLERALEILRNKKGVDGPEVAAAENRLATAYTGHGRYDEAEKLLMHALPIAKATWPAGHIVTADALYSLGEVERLQRRYEAAEPCYKEAVEIYQKLGDRHSLSLAQALHQYAEMLKKHEPREAKEMEKRSQTILRNVPAFQ
jgi:tetratricopeptide (TPR) repeat protein